MKISNPIYYELLKLKLIKSKNIIKISNKTRDKKIAVFKDIKSKIIFLQKYLSTQEYYKAVKYGFNYVKTGKGRVSTPEIEDDIRRANQFKRILKNKNVLDFGCGRGGFLSKIKKFKNLYGIELRKECLSIIRKKYRKINVSNNINNFNNKFDVITMFHVLEHVPYQVEILKILKSKLNKNGKIIIEVPHSEDFLLSFDNLKEFKNFTFWSEHLVLHTENSLKKILKKSGFKKIKIEFFQRYNLNNHLGWFLKRKPGGHYYFKSLNTKKLNKKYMSELVKFKKTDTLIATAVV